VLVDTAKKQRPDRTRRGRFCCQRRAAAARGPTVTACHSPCCQCKPTRGGAAGGIKDHHWQAPPTHPPLMGGPFPRTRSNPEHCSGSGCGGVFGPVGRRLAGSSPSLSVTISKRGNLHAPRCWGILGFEGRRMGVGLGRSFACTAAAVVADAGLRQTSGPAGGCDGTGHSSTDTTGELSEFSSEDVERTSQTSGFRSAGVLPIVRDATGASKSLSRVFSQRIEST
jgi:hypothetical protein